MNKQKGFAGVVAIIVVIVAIIVGGAYVVMRQEAQAPADNVIATPPSNELATSTELNFAKPTATTDLSDTWGDYKIVYEGNPAKETASLVKISTQQKLYTEQLDRALYISNISQYPYIVLAATNCHYCSGSVISSIIVNAKNQKSMIIKMGDVIKFDIQNDEVVIQNFNYGPNPCSGDACPPPSKVIVGISEQDLSGLN